jgi:hypothetical protein
MREYRKLLISALLLVVVAAAGAFLLRRVTRPPEAARLLPEGDLLIYANFRPAHLFEAGRPSQLEEHYKDFIQQTGIEFERDLEEVAVSRQDTPDGRDVESSEVFIAHFDSGRVNNYFQKTAAAKEQYLDQTIFLFPHEGHTVRVSVLRGDTIAVTNMDSANPMHRIIDRLDSSGAPSLLESYYHQVPAASVAWMICRIPAKGNGLQLPGGMTFSFHQDAVAVASLRYAGALLFRADFHTQSDADARELADSINTFVALSRTIGRSAGPKQADPDMKTALDSVQAQQNGNTTVVTAKVPANLLRKVASEVQIEGEAPATGKH